MRLRTLITDRRSTSIGPGHFLVRATFAIAGLLVAISLVTSNGSTSAVDTAAPLAPPCSIPSFGPATLFTVGSARSLAAADFNGDNKQDLVVTNNTSASNVRILLSNGTGGFTNNGNFPVGRNPVSVAVADFNSDGKTDVITANGSSGFPGGDASVILGNGAGGFGSPTHIRWTSFSFPAQSTSVAVGDLNSDGKPDVAVTSVSLIFGSTTSTILTAINDGTGQFTTLQTISTPNTPSNIIASDLNGDSKTDLAFLTSSFSRVSVLIGNGMGQFGAATNFSTGTNPSSLTSGDFNGDGSVDLASANLSTNDVSVLFNNGSGAFSIAATYSSGGLQASSVRAGDFNGDAVLDLAVVNRDPRNILILQNLGTGTFKPIAAFLTGGFDPQFIGTGDFNGDDRTDLAVAQELGQRVSVLINNCDSPVPSTLALAELLFNLSEGAVESHVTVVRNGSLEGSATVQYASSNGTAVAPDDFTAVSGTLNFADGEASKAININVVQDSIDEGVEETFPFTLSNATGSPTLGSPSSATVFIFDDDPLPQISISDVFIPEGNASSTTASFSVTLSAPSGTTVSVSFATADAGAVAPADYLAASGTLSFAPGETSKTIPVSIVGDISGEIHETFFVNLSNPTNASLVVTQGVGTIFDDDSACPSPKFQLTSNLLVSAPIDVVAADLNGDTKKDLVVANNSTNSVVVFLSDGNGGFAAPASFNADVRPLSIGAGDFNGDLKLDVVTVNEASMAILFGNGTGGLSLPVQTPLSNPRSVVVGDVNGDNKLDLAIVVTTPVGNGSVSILLGNGLGGFGTPTSYAVGQSPLFGALANFNNDNKLDIVVANQNSFDLSILINNGDGTFGAATSIPLGYNVFSVLAGDLNGDGKVDLVAMGSTPEGRLSTLLGNGDGSFSSPTTTAGNPVAFRGSLGDLNSDGRLDLATGRLNGINPGSLSVQFGSGTGAFSSPTNYTLGMGPLAVTIADFNSDTKPDIAVLNIGSGTVSILVNTCASVPLTTFQFSSSNYIVNEGTSGVNVTVTRNGDTSTSASVSYKTTDTDTFTFGCSDAINNNFGAYGRCDYATSVDTLTFSAGETSKTFAIPIINDAFAEGVLFSVIPETFGIELVEPSGGTLGTPSKATITINDNDQVDGANPIFTTPFFVRQHYLDFLSREPEAGEPWSAVLNGCSDVNNNPACDRLTVSGAFFGSPEFRLKGFFVFRFYKLAFNRLPLYSEIVVDMRAVTGTTPSETFQKKATFTNNFVTLAEFVSLYNALTNTQFVNTLMGRYGLTSITTPDPANPDGATKVTLSTADLINRLNGVGGTLTRAQVLRAIADSDEVGAAEANQAFVAMQYYGYLRRTPETAGFNSWINHLNANPTDFRTMVNGFMNSAEYRLRFGPPQ